MCIRDRGKTLSAFANYAMCQGQQQSAALGYSPMPINLVQAAFAQIAKIPGANVQSINIQSCNNPTFTPSGVNLLAQTAPYPPACDKQGPTQCTTGTGGAAAVATPVSKGATTTAAGSGPGATGTGAGVGATAAGAAAAGSAAGSGAASCDPTTGACTTASGDSSSLSPTAATATLAAGTGWTSTQTLLVLVSLALLAILLIPGLLSRRLDRHRTP